MILTAERPVRARHFPLQGWWAEQVLKRGEVRIDCRLLPALVIGGSSWIRLPLAWSTRADSLGLEPNPLSVIRVIEVLFRYGSWPASADAISMNGPMDFPNTARPESCGNGNLKRLFASPFSAKA